MAESDQLVIPDAAKNGSKSCATFTAAESGGLGVEQLSTLPDGEAGCVVEIESQWTAWARERLGWNPHPKIGFHRARPGHPA